MMTTGLNFPKYLLLEDYTLYVPLGTKVYGLYAGLFPVARILVSKMDMMDPDTGRVVKVVQVYNSNTHGFVVQKTMTYSELEKFLDEYELVPA